MAQPLHLGTFQLVSSDVVITDPGYYEQTLAEVPALGCILSHCASGEWECEMVEDFTEDHPWKMPKNIFAFHRDVARPAENATWQRMGDEIGGDSGLIALCDREHFHDPSLVPPGQKWTFNGGPADPDDLWYSYVCELSELRRMQRSFRLGSPSIGMEEWMLTFVAPARA